LFQMPIDVFLERGDPLAVLAHQLFWAVALFALGRVALARGSRRLVVQGG
jgi:ABC-2 type transport system permease protein